MASRIRPGGLPGREQGWGQGDFSQSGLTQAERQEQEDLQLAIQAATAVAPEVVADERRAGGGQQVESDGDYGQSGSGQTPALDSTQSQPRPQTSGGDDTSAGTPSWGGHFFSMETFLAPFLHPEATQVLQSAARGGERHLNDALHRLSGNGRVQEFHKAIPLLLSLTDLIRRDHGLAAELRRTLRVPAARLSQVAIGRVTRHLGENRPLSGGFVALRSVLDLEIPALSNDPQVKKRGRIILDRSNATISGAIFVRFDGDVTLGSDTETPEEEMARLAREIQDSINDIIGNNSLDGNEPIRGEITVIPLEPGSKPPSGSHTFTYGGGASDKEWDIADGENPQNLSWATKCGNDGYLYSTGDAGHEFLHWLGLEDRYTEIVILTGGLDTGGTTGANTNENGAGLPVATWGRVHSSEPTSLPLGKVRDGEPDYFCMTNAMAVKGPKDLTKYQLGIIFDKKCEESYARDVIGYLDLPPYIIVGKAVEFDPSHTAYWWDVEDNRRIPNNSANEGPATFRRVGSFYFGQNFHRINTWVHDSRANHTQISGHPDTPDERNNREAVNIAIKKNQ